MRAEYNKLKRMELKRLKQELNKIYGFKTPESWKFRELGSNRIWLLTPEAAVFNTEGYNIETKGVYFCYFDKERLRLSPEGAQLVGEDASKNIIDLNHEEAMKIIRGFNLNKEVNASAEYVILRTRKGVIGVGKNKKSEILCQFRKNRRIKTF